MLIVKEKLVVLKNQLQGNVCLEGENSGGGTDYSKAYYIVHDSVAIKFMYVETANINYHRNNEYYTTILLSFYKLDVDDKNQYKVIFRSKELKINTVFTTVDKGTWHMIYKGKQLQNIDVNATVDRIVYQSTLSAMHDDTELTDFEMEAVDGSVRVHRAVLAAASPVLRRMLCGEWREAASGRVQLPDTTRQTLQYFKDYAYLGELPEDGSALRPLLLLAAYLMMPALEGRCVQVLAKGLNPDSTYELIEFAVNNKLTKLVKKILERVEWGAMKGADITTC